MLTFKIAPCLTQVPGHGLLFWKKHFKYVFLSFMFFFPSLWVVAYVDSSKL